MIYVIEKGNLVIDTADIKVIQRYYEDVAITFKNNITIMHKAASGEDAIGVVRALTEELLKGENNENKRTD